MFVHMSIHYPKLKKEQLLIDSMHRFGKAMEGKEGLIAAHTTKDEDTGRLIGLAIWNSKEQEFFMLPEIQNQRGRKWKKVLIPMDDWLRFFGIWLAEGCVHTDNHGNYRIYVAQTPKTKEWDIIDSWLKKIPFHFGINGLECHGPVTFY